MKQHRKTPAGSAGSPASELSRKMNALVLLLEEKGVLEPGEFEDSLMNLKIQLGDQMPQISRPPRGRQARGNDYIGPERRREVRGDRGKGKDRRGKMRTPVAHISGDVHQVSGELISGAQLILRRSVEGAQPIQFRSTKSDMQGRFVFLNLPMQTDSEPYQQYSYQIEVRYRNRTLEVIREIKLVSDQTSPHHIRLQLEES